MWYIGSKRRLGKEIMPFIYKALKIFPNGKYIEPFIGGANMIDQVKHHTKIGCDANKHLIALLNQVRVDPDKILKVKSISPSSYEHIRSNKEKFVDWFVGLAGLLPTFNNQWFGSYCEDPDSKRFAKSITALLKQDISDVKLINCDYKQIPVGSGNVIYCDPPYKIQDYYGMPFNHDEFYEWVRQASRHNIVFVSEYEMPPDFACVWKKKVKPAINPNSRHKIEKLFIYKG